MKAKKLAKRLRARADEVRLMADLFRKEEQDLRTHALILVDVLQEVADQVSPPRPKKEAKKAATDNLHHMARRHHETMQKLGDTRVGLGAGD